MNDIAELISQVCRTGASMYAEPPHIMIRSPRHVPSELKDKLRDRRQDVLSYLELQASMERLESAGISIAVFEDGSMRVIATDIDSATAVEAGGIVYSPNEMFQYVNLNRRERRMLHDFKKRFGVTGSGGANNNRT